MSLTNGAEPGRFWMAVEGFRAFQTTRPDEEGWELIDGVPVMTTPTCLTHARIAGNVERLLFDTLDAFDPSRVAMHGIGVDLGSSRATLPGLGAGHAPQPNVAVEVVSGTDDAWIASAGMRWIDAKTRIYQAHAFCEAVLAVEQRRLEARPATRSGAGWRTTVFTRPEDALDVPTCGLRCRLADLYRGTPPLRGRPI